MKKQKKKKMNLLTFHKLLGLLIFENYNHLIFTYSNH